MPSHSTVALIAISFAVFALYLYFIGDFRISECLSEAEDTYSSSIFVPNNVTIMEQFSPDERR